MIGEFISNWFFGKVATAILLPLCLALGGLTAYYRYDRHILNAKIIELQQDVENCKAYLDSAIDTFKLDDEQNELTKKYIKELQKATVPDGNPLTPDSLRDFLDKLRQKSGAPTDPSGRKN